MMRRAIAAWLGAGLWAPMSGAAQSAGVALLAGRMHRGLGDFHRLSQAAGQLPVDERPGFVNDKINRGVGYASDESQWGEIDHWQTPAETLTLQFGDCEDLAIAKFFLLHECAAPCCSGVRLLYATCAPPDAPGRAKPHIVALAAGTPDDPLVFDNLNPKLLPLSRRTDLTPVLSFDASTLWRGASRQRFGDAAVLLRPWRELLQRWQRQRQAEPAEGPVYALAGKPAAQPLAARPRFSALISASR